MAKTPDDDSAHPIRVIARAAQVLRALEGEPDGLSLAQIAARVDLARSTVQRIVEALRHEHLLTSASLAGGVRLGPALIRLAASASISFDHVIRPFMTELSKAIGETVDLSVLQGRSAVFTDQIQGRHRLRTVSAVGDRFPLYCTANGKGILSVLPDKRLIPLLPSPLGRLTPHTITKREDLLKAITLCRRTGIAIDDEEHTEGISAVGTGFIDPMGRALAISIPVPTARFNRMRAELTERLLAARKQIGIALDSPTIS